MVIEVTCVGSVFGQRTITDNRATNMSDSMSKITHTEGKAFLQLATLRADTDQFFRSEAWRHLRIHSCCQFERKGECNPDIVAV